MTPARRMTPTTHRIPFLRDEMGKATVSVAAAVIVLAASSTYCVLPLLRHGSIPMGHDTLFHIFQADQFRQGMQSGLVYPRWAADANNGHGSPNFIFYAPLAYYLVFLVRLWDSSLIMSMIYVIWAGFFLSGVTMLFAARKLFGKPGSLLSAVAYQMLPFHLIDLYHRGTFPELLTYPLLPLFFYFLVKTSDSGGSRSYMAGLSLCYAGMILTHIATAFVFTVFAGCWLLYGLCRRGGATAVVKTAVSLVIGLGVSAVYLGPAVLEREHVQIGVLAKNIYPYAGIFLFDSRPHLHELFFRFLYITVVLEAGIFLLTLLPFHKRSAAETRTGSNRFPMFAFIGAFYLTTPLSGPVWNLIPQFPFLQFPWRWIIVMELCLCFLIASSCSLDALKDFRLARFRKTFLLVLMVFLAQLPMQNDEKAAITETDFNRLAGRNQWRHAVDEKPEYLPVWTTDLASVLRRSREDRAGATRGEAAIRVTEWAPESRTIEVRASSDSVIRLSTFYYPGWELTKNGKHVDMETERETGAILVSVPAGAHTIRLKFGDTPLRKTAKYATFVCLLLLIPVAIFLGGSAGSEGRSSSQ